MPPPLDRGGCRRRVACSSEIALRGTWLDADDVHELLRLSLPGSTSSPALLELLRFGRSGRYDLIVVDTAPTGHTLRMLGDAGGRSRESRSVFDAMQDKHRAIVGALRGRWTPDAADELRGSGSRRMRGIGEALSGILSYRA